MEKGDPATARTLAGRGLDLQLDYLQKTAAVQTEQQQLRMTSSTSNQLNTWSRSLPTIRPPFAMRGNAFSFGRG